MGLEKFRIPGVSISLVADVFIKEIDKEVFDCVLVEVSSAHVKLKLPLIMTLIGSCVSCDFLGYTVLNARSSTVSASDYGSESSGFEFLRTHH